MTDTTTTGHRPAAETGDGCEVGVVRPAGGDEVIVVVDGDPIPPVDHRLRARRIEVRRAARRHRRRVWGSILGVLAVVAACTVAVFSPLLDVDRIEVTGVDRLDPDEVVSANDGVRGVPLLWADLASVRERTEALPWVARVRVERRWPDHLVVRVTERAPVAIVATEDGQRHLVLTGGRVPRGRPTRADEGLPVIALAGGVSVTPGTPLPDAVGASVEMVASLPASVRSKARAATVDAAGDAVVALAPSGSLLLGRAERVAEKYDTAATMLSGAAALDCLTRLDVRIPHAPTLLRAPGCR